MKDHLRDLVERTKAPLQQQNIVREYLQARILGSLQRSGAMVPLAFQGGTALRFLYRLPRFSEDLDFALENPSGGYDFRRYLREIGRELEREGYTVGFRVSDRRTVHSAFVRLPGLLNELGLSRRREESLSVKIEVDTRPPPGAQTEITVVRRHVLLRLQHHDRASLLAGKLHALLQRPFLKGRDVFDLVWYLSDPGWPGPNLPLLNHALGQTGWEGAPVTSETWRAAVWERLAARPWERVVADVAPFVEREAELDLLTPEHVGDLLMK